MAAATDADSAAILARTAPEGARLALLELG